MYTRFMIPTPAMPRIIKLLPFPKTISTFSPKPSSEPFLVSLSQNNGNTNIYASNRTIDCFLKSGSLSSALQVFDEMPFRDVVTWNLMINGYSRFGFPIQAIYMYGQMVAQGTHESPSTFSTVTGICCDSGFYRQGIQVHCRVNASGLGSDLYAVSSLVDLYMHMGLFGGALKLFDGLSSRNLGIWNVVLRGFCESGCASELLELFSEMRLECVGPNGLTLCYVMRGCSNGRLVCEGRQMHCQTIKTGFEESNLFVKNTLVDLYSACGELLDTRKSFEAIPPSDVISWNSIVYIYAENSALRDAVLFFNRMQLWDKRPSARSLLGFLSWSSLARNLLFGNQIHCCVTKLGFSERNPHVHSALINMYGKCGDIESSISIFKSVPERTLESGNSLMTSFFHFGAIEDTIEMFNLMVDEGIGFDDVTLSTTLKSLAASGKFTGCKLLHCFSIKSGFESHLSVSNSLIDSYSKFGHVELAREIFENIAFPNVICFTSIINGYARNGMGLEGLEMFKEMTSKGLAPDEVTFLCVLIGCSHSGLVQEGRSVFYSMKNHYEIDHTRQHYSCMVDMLGRAGFLEEAENLLRQSPDKDDCVMWGSVLHSCRVHRNDVVGKRAADILMELRPENPAVYLQASSFYSEIGDFEASVEAREISTAMRIRRDIGRSLVETARF